MTNFDHWKNGEYGDPKTHYFANKLRAKGERSKNLYQLVVTDHMKNNGGFLIDGRNPIINEFGCNVGRNLFPFYCAGWKVGGVDLNLESIEQAGDLMAGCRKNFRQLDLFNQVNVLSNVPDNCFDVTFCMGFLMHLPDSASKKKLVSEMIRISKSCYIYEPYGRKEREESDPNQKGWYLSMVDYEKYDLGLEIYPVQHYVEDNRDMRIWRTLK